MHVLNVSPEEVFQALADGTRVRIVRLMAHSGEEACLCELVDSLLEPQYNVSRHLKVLRHVGLLSAEKEGRFIYHRLVQGPSHLARLCAAIRALPDSGGTFVKDLRRFRDRMRLRQAGRCTTGIQIASLAGERRARRAA